MTTDSQFTDVEQRLQDLRADGEVAQSKIEALLDSDDSMDRQAGVKAVALTVRGEDDCFTEELPSLAPYLTDTDTDVRLAALQTAIELLPLRDELVADAPAILDCLDDDSDRVAERALVATSILAEHAPDEAATAVPTVVEFLDHDRSPVQKEAVRFFAHLTTERPNEVVPAVDRLVSLLGRTYESPDFDEDHWNSTLSHEHMRTSVVQHTHAERSRHLTIRNTIVQILVVLAQEQPSAVLAQADALREFLDATEPHVRESALTVLTALADEHPDAIIRASDDVWACLDAGLSDDLNAAAIRALGAIASQSPDHVVERALSRVDRLLDFVDHETPHVRGATLGVLSYVAEHQPSAVEPATSAVVDCLDDDHAFVRGNAVWVLGTVASPAAVQALQERRTVESDPDVQSSIVAALERTAETDGRPEQ